MRLRGELFLCNRGGGGGYSILLLCINAFVHALPQMAVLEIQSNGDSSYVSQEAINSAIQSLEDPLQRVSPSAAEAHHSWG